MTSNAADDRSPSDERVWLERIRRSETPAFAALFHAYYNRLCIYARTFVDTAETAEELVEELFVRIWEHRTEWEVKQSLRHYLYTAVRNRAITHLRHEQVRVRVHEQVSDASRGVGSAPPGMGEPEASPDARIQVAELRAVVKYAIQRLPERCREAFVLSRQHELTHAQIAGIMNISVSTVEKHIVRATKVLREAIDRTM